MRMMSIDPGAVHCGTANWLDASCYHVEEFLPGALFVALQRALTAKALDVVVCEEYRLYPWKSAEQGFSTVETCEVIGVIKYLCALHGVELVMQSATIKKPTEGHMRAKKIPNKAVKMKAGGHCKDAVLHGQHYLMNKTGD